MPASLLASQFRSLEPLQPEEKGVRIDINMTPEAAVDIVLDEKWPYRNDAIASGSLKGPEPDTRP
jgi:hypothetical protein